MDRDDKMMLFVFLSDFLVNKLLFKVKYASELVGSLVCKNETTVLSSSWHFPCVMSRDAQSLFST